MNFNKKSFTARDLWKKRYFEEKKKTNPLEEQCNRLRHELDIIHRKLMNTLEGPKEKQTKVGDLKPSKQVGENFGSTGTLQSVTTSQDSPDYNNRYNTSNFNFPYRQNIANRLQYVQQDRYPSQFPARPNSIGYQYPKKITAQLPTYYREKSPSPHHAVRSSSPWKLSRYGSRITDPRSDYKPPVRSQYYNNQYYAPQHINYTQRPVQQNINTRTYNPRPYHSNRYYY